MRAYARFSKLNTLRLDLLNKQIQILGASPYASDLYATLETMAEDVTERLDSLLDCPVLPWYGTRRIRLTEPHKVLHLGAPLIDVASVRKILVELEDGTFDWQTLGTSEFRHYPNSSYIDLGGPGLVGEWEVTGTWGFCTSNRAKVTVGSSVTTAAQCLAGAVAMQLTTTASFEDGDVLFDVDRNQAFVVTSASGTNLAFDQWCVPEQTVPTATELLYCGRLMKTLERAVLVMAFLDAWRSVTGRPEPSTLESEKADRHSYKRSDVGETLFTSYAHEADRALTHVRRVLRPFQPR